MKMSFTVNGEKSSIEVAPDALLLDVIRASYGTGTKEGCGVGVCGLCTVIVDDVPVSSCIYFAACADGREIWTVEGSRNVILHCLNPSWSTKACNVGSAPRVRWSQPTP